MEDWDLQAVVRSCSGAAGTEARRDPLSGCSSPLLLQEDEEDLFFRFPNLLETQTVLQELDELWKPFFPKSESQPQTQQKNLMAPMSHRATPSCSSGVALLPQDVLLKTKQPHRPLSQTTRAKRRKKQQKKVVCQVPANGLSSDMWAWRKYGQKPIKGSPFPRGYYRCSSSKECLARKQVERSRTDPGLYVITYTAEHNHPIPAHRNSLAGSTRHKFPQSNNQANGVAGVSSSSSLSVEEDLLLPPRREEEVDKMEEEEETLLVSDMEVLGEDDMMILRFDELQRSNSDDASPECFAAGGR